MVEINYLCPFNPNTDCNCSSGFAKSIFDFVVEKLMTEKKITLEEASREYRNAIIARPITPIEAGRFSSICSNSATVFVNVKKKN